MARIHVASPPASIVPVLVLAAALAPAAAARAQAPPAGDTKNLPVSKVERKNRAPVSNEILKVKLPHAAEVTLENGMVVLVVEDHRLPGVVVRMEVTGAGTLYDPPDRPGLAAVTAQMLREGGTKTRSSRQLAEDVGGLGATVAAFAVWGSDVAMVTASGLSDNLDQWFPILADVLLQPSFAPDELAKLRQRIKVQLKQQRASPDFLLDERFSRAVFGAHPAAVVSATEASLDALAPETLARWHRERYTPQNTILGIAGDVRAADLVPKLRRWLGGWPRTGLDVALPPDPSPTTARRVFLVDRPGSVQTSVAIGNIAIGRRDPDYPAMVVMNRIVGGGPAARLFLNLREEKGYTYGVYSSFDASRYPGPWQAGGEVRTPVTEGAMAEFMKEIRRIREEPVPAAELEDARRGEVARFALSLEQPGQLLGYAMARKAYGFPEDYWDTYPAKLAAVTAADVQRLAREYLDPDKMVVAAVGDASKIRTVLAQYGPLEVYDIEGHAMAAAPAVP
jgi:zinc protease